MRIYWLVCDCGLREQRMYKMIRLGRVRFLNVLAEAALIVFSILFALYTNRWREGHMAQQRVSRDIVAIRAELQQNRAILTDVLPYHQQEVKSFERFLQRPDLEQHVRGKDMIEALHANREELTFHGVWNPSVTPSSLSDTAWKTALANGDLPIMDPDLVKALTDYYTYQSVPVMLSLNDIGQLYMSPQAYDPNQTVTMLRTLQGTFYELADQEEDLLHSANQTLHALDAK